MSEQESLNKSKSDALRQNMVQAAINAAARSGKRFIDAAESTFPETSDSDRMREVHEEVLRDLANLKPHILGQSPDGTLVKGLDD